MTGESFTPIGIYDRESYMRMTGESKIWGVTGDYDT